MSNFEKTLENLNDYLINNKEKYVISQKIGSSRFVVIERVQDLTCYITCHVVERCKCLSIAIYPRITCPESRREQLREYFEKVNNVFYSGRLLMDSEGKIYIQSSQKYIDAPLSTETISFMFFELNSIFEFTLNEIRKKVYNFQDERYYTSD